MAKPDTKAKRSGGNQIVANFNTPTKAKAEPKPTIKRPAAATPNTGTVKRYDPSAQTKHANVNKRRGPYLSIIRPTGKLHGIVGIIVKSC